MNMQETEKLYYRQPLFYARWNPEKLRYEVTRAEYLWISKHTPMHLTVEPEFNRVRMDKHVSEMHQGYVEATKDAIRLTETHLADIERDLRRLKAELP